MDKTQLHTYSIEIWRSTRLKDPLDAAMAAIRQAQAEASLARVIYAEDLSNTEAGFYYSTGPGRCDLTIWTNSVEDMLDVITDMQDRYGFDAINLKNTIQVHDRGVFDGR
jgi:hypothetical protein